MSEQLSTTESRVASNRPWATPAVDLLENGSEFRLIADVPGVDAENVELRYEQGELVVEAESATDEAAPDAHVEFGPVRYRRVFQLPDVVDSSGISAELTHGVLTVTLPKQESVKPRQITVRAG